MDKEVHNFESVGWGRSEPKIKLFNDINIRIGKQSHLPKHTKWCNRGATAMDTMDAMDTRDV